MTEAEARQFLIAWQNYLRHLSVSASQKTVDLVTAVGVTVFLYVPRGMAFAERRKGPPAPPQQAQVFRFHPAPAPVPEAPEAPEIDVTAEPVH